MTEIEKLTTAECRMRFLGCPDKARCPFENSRTIYCLHGKRAQQDQSK